MAPRFTSGELVPGLQEAWRLMLEHALLCEQKGYRDTARILRAEARTLQRLAESEQAEADREPTSPGAAVTRCPSCGTEWLARK